MSLTVTDKKLISTQEELTPPAAPSAQAAAVSAATAPLFQERCTPGTPEQKKQTALEFAKREPAKMAQEIQNWGLGEEIRFEIAKIWTSSLSFWNLSIYFTDIERYRDFTRSVRQSLRNFQISDPKKCEALAELWARKQCILAIDCLNITDPETVQRLVYLALECQPSLVLPQLPELPLSPDLRKKLLSFYIEKDPTLLVEYLHLFGIEKESDRYEIVKECITKDWALPRVLPVDQFGEENYWDLVRFGLARYFASPDPIDPIAYPLNTLHFGKTRNKNITACSIESLIAEHLSGCGFEWILPYLRAIEDPAICKEVRASLQRMLLFSWAHRSPEELLWMNQKGLLKHVYELHLPYFYRPFAEWLIQGSIPAVRECFEQLLPLDLERYPYVRLLRFAIAQCHVQGVQHLEILTELLNEGGKAHKTFKDGPKVKLLINVLKALSLTEELNTEQKSAVIKGLLIEGANLFQSAQKLEIFFDLNLVTFLQDLEPSPNALFDTLRRALSSLFGQTMPFSFENFDRTFGKSRNPHAVWQFFGRIHPLKVAANTQSFERYIRSVCDGSFLEKRYSREDNLHLRTLPPVLLEGWKQALDPQVCPSDPSLRVIDTDDPYDLLLCGEEVQNSCQRFQGKPEELQGLLGIILHGQTRLFAVVNRRGNIRARVLVRLLFYCNSLNPTKGYPVLLISNCYGDETFQEVLEDRVKEKAKRLRLCVIAVGSSDKRNFFLHGEPVVLPIEPSSESLPKVPRVVSLGGPASYEYFDGIDEFGLSMPEGKIEFSYFKFIHPLLLPR